MAYDDTHSRATGDAPVAYGEGEADAPLLDGSLDQVQPRPEGADYFVENSRTGESLWFSAIELEALTGVEIGYLDWCIECDRKFEQGEWRISK